MNASDLPSGDARNCGASAAAPVPALLELIPYRTRDLTRLLPGTARTMRRMEKITGRSDDMMIVRGVNVFPSQIEEYILKRDGSYSRVRL